MKQFNLYSRRNLASVIILLILLAACKGLPAAVPATATAMPVAPAPAGVRPVGSRFGASPFRL